MTNTWNANRLADDLNHILRYTEGLWEALRGQQLFLTGGTGFFGCWILESIAWANAQLGLGMTVRVLTRDPEAFGKKAPHLASDPSIQLHPGDVRSFDFPRGNCAYVIHAAGSPDPKLQPSVMLETLSEGTHHTLEFAKSCRAKRVLFLSSRAVYGPQPSRISHVPEHYRGVLDPSDPWAAYAEGKRLAERFCDIYGEKHGLQVTTARCFASLGPYQPLDVRFASGNFIRDALRGGPICVESDGTAIRSYLYAADLTIWLWHILLKGQAGRVYNAGSEQEITIADLARVVATACGAPVEVRIAKTPSPGHVPERQLPSIERAATELGLRQTIELGEAVKRTLRWHQHTETNAPSMAR